LRLSLFIALVLAGISTIRFTPVGEVFTEERVLDLVETLRSLWWAPCLLVGLYAIVSAFGLPPVPLLVAGAAFGPVYGSITNIAGLTLGAFTAYWEARLLGREFVVRVTGDRLRRAERLFERHGFWPMVQTRFLPIPFSVVNFGAALAGVRPVFFMLATALGLVPSTLIHTWFIAETMTTQGRERAHTLALYAGVFVLFNALLSIQWFRERIRRRRRYRELVLLRAEAKAREGLPSKENRNEQLDRP
jgi:uncharacterized membrane protein YdjX (TVP38/TMEM64 family)